MNLNQIRQKYIDAERKAKKEYIEEINQYLKDHKLDGDVIRISDGRVGRLQLDNHCKFINFYPYTKEGKISLNSSGYISMLKDDITEFEPY